MSLSIRIYGIRTFKCCTYPEILVALESLDLLDGVIVQVQVLKEAQLPEISHLRNIVKAQIDVLKTLRGFKIQERGQSVGSNVEMRHVAQVG